MLPFDLQGSTNKISFLVLCAGDGEIVPGSTAGNMKGDFEETASQQTANPGHCCACKPLSWDTCWEVRSCLLGSTALPTAEQKWIFGFRCSPYWEHHGASRQLHVDSTIAEVSPQHPLLQQSCAGPDVTADIQVIRCNLFCFRRGKSFGSSMQREPFREKTLNIRVHFADQYLQSCTKLSLATGLLLQDLPPLSSSSLSPAQCRICISTAQTNANLNPVQTAELPQHWSSSSSDSSVLSLHLGFLPHLLALQQPA